MKAPCKTHYYLLILHVLRENVLFFLYILEEVIIQVLSIGKINIFPIDIFYAIITIFVSPYLLGNPNLGDTHRISDHIGLTSNTYNGYSLIRQKKGL